VCVKELLSILLHRCGIPYDLQSCSKPGPACRPASSLCFHSFRHSQSVTSYSSLCTYQCLEQSNVKFFSVYLWMRKFIDSLLNQKKVYNYIICSVIAKSFFCFKYLAHPVALYMKLQGRGCTYNVTMRHVVWAIVGMKKQ